jgi:hypothetical protein
LKICDTHKIGGNEVNLYQIKFITNKLGWTPMAVRQKEKRGIIPPANFRSETGIRLYAVEEMAMFEYLFKDLWPHRQGTATPLWLKSLAHDTSAVLREKIVACGRLNSEDDFLELEKKYSAHGFNKYRAWIYVLAWRATFEEASHNIIKELISEIE